MRALNSHPNGLEMSEVKMIFERMGFSSGSAYSRAYSTMQALIDQGVATYDHRNSRLIPTGKGLTMVEIIDGKEVKVVY